MLDYLLTILFLIQFSFMFNKFSWFMMIFVLMILSLFFSFTKFMNTIYFLNSYMFIDGMSYTLIILTIWIFCLSILGSSSFFTDSNFYMFNMNLIFLFLILFMTFLVSKLIYFFFFFESSLIPTLYLIIGWGMKIERIQSGLYMFYYTLFGSLPMMLGINYIYKLNFSGSMNLLLINPLNFFFYGCMIFAFLMKIPMFLFHSWLPKAHVEAPLSGSMILAGVLLKLGGYGFMRFNMFFVEICNVFVYFVYVVSLLGGLISGLMCFCQSDLKSLIAYSSVSHMSMIICSLLSWMNFGFFGSLMMMISHGFCSSSLFYLVNLNYERIFSRSILFNKGFLSLVPSLSFWWFMFCSCNMSCPPSLNLFSEILMLSSIICFSFLNLFFVLIMPFVSMVYSLSIYSFCQHGKPIFFNGMVNTCFVREYLILFLHFLPLFFSFLNLGIYMLY